jgi:hypothetical protein
MKSILGMMLMATLTIAGCQKEDFEDAPFRCKIDRKEFVVSDDLLAVTVSGGNNFYIQATRVANPLNDDLYGEMKLDFSTDSTGTIALNASNTWRWSNNGGETFRSDGTDPGTLTITSLDMNAKRMTGTFELTAYNGDRSASRSITEGFFDISW